jgi:hypothetical protein
MNRYLSRRLVLRGAGVAITLPWLESLLLPSVAKAQAAGAAKRYIPIFLPNGASDNWKPTGAGSGGAWQLSPVLDVFAELKAKMQVITNLENGSSFNTDSSNSVEPSHGRQPGAWLTCTSPDVAKDQLKVAEANGISIDQQMAQHAVFKDKTPLASLQVGLSTVESYCDGRPCSNSRSISWSAPTTPMYKQVDPLQVFNKIVGVIQTEGNGPTPPDPEMQKRYARNKSVLDAVLESATRTQAKLGKGDKMRIDEFLTSVRAIEKKATGASAGMGGVACSAIAQPNMATVLPTGPKQNTATYNKGTHADVMNDLIVMALQCDATRIISYMLEDERSEFTYDHVKVRTFTATGSTEGNGTCPEYHGGGQHGSQDAFASITRWNAGKVAELAKKLDALKEADGSSILDNTVIFFGGAMHGSNHKCNELPTALIGGGKLGLKQDNHVSFTSRPLRDLHFTLLNHAFGIQVADFGNMQAKIPPQMMAEIIGA